MKKIKVGIDVNEILRARWLQFDRYYVQEFGKKGTSPDDNAYVFDFFNNYKFEDTEEVTKILKDEFIEKDINPQFYKVDKKTGKADIDDIAFKEEREKLTAKQVYNKFLYQDYTFEIFGAASEMYKNENLDLGKFYQKYKNFIDVVIISKENWFTIPPTLFFLSKTLSRFKRYYFPETNKEILNEVDVFITTDPEILNMDIPKNKTIIKLDRPYNEKIKKGKIQKKALYQINDLIDNKKFEKIIKYKKTRKNG